MDKTAKCIVLQADDSSAEPPEATEIRPADTAPFRSELSRQEGRSFALCATLPWLGL